MDWETDICEKSLNTKKTLAVHLNAPLKIDKLLRCLYRCGMQKHLNFTDEYLRRHLRIDRNLNTLLQKLSATTSLIVPNHHIGFQHHRQSIFEFLWKSRKQEDLKIFENFKGHLKRSIDNIKLQSDLLGEVQFNIPSVNDILDHEGSILLFKYFKAKTMIENGIVVSATLESSKQKKHISGWQEGPNRQALYDDPHTGFMISIWNELSIIQLKNTTLYGAREHLLEIGDVFSQRFMVLLSSIVGNSLNYSHYLSVSQCEDLFEWGDAIINEQGNDGYLSVSMWESLILGMLMNHVKDDYVDNTKFLQSMKQEFLKKNPLNQKHYDKLEKLFLTFTANQNQIFQAFGLYRIWGHPSINSAEGIRKLKKFACAPRPFNYNKISLIARKFKEYLCCSYFTKNSCWPVLDCENLPKYSYIRNSIERNLAIDKTHPSYDPYDWQFVTAKKTFDIPKQYDISEMISDKAMSHNYPDLVKSIIEKGHIGKATERSVLIQWINSDLGDPEEFLQRIDKEGFPKEETVVGVCPKERELKVYARLFGLLTLVKRMYVVVTEALIADNLLPLFPEITMKDDQSQLLSRHYNNTKHMQGNGKFVNIVLNSDFEKWNSNMREEETKECFQFIDGLFGFSNVVSRTHQMFKNSQLYLADGTYCPKVLKNGMLLEDDYVWSGHLGGIEGLRQKGWTLWTVTILKYVCETVGVKAQIIGQGDNQVIICKYPHSLGKEGIYRRHNKFLNTLEDFLKDIGPPLKKDETWCSSSLFMYGKFPIYKGSPMSMSQKKICRMMKLSNDGFPTIESCLSSLSASLFDSSWMDNNIIVPYLCYSFVLSESLSFHLRTSLLDNDYLKLSLRNKYFKIPNNAGGQHLFKPDFPHSLLALDETTINLLIKMLMIFPINLGGYPISLIGDVLIRGFSDPVTASLSQVKKIYNKCASPIEKGILHNMLNPVLNLFINYDNLFEDPTCLNLLSASSPSDQMKRLVLDMILSPSFKKGTYFQNFLSKATADISDIKQLLIKMTPVFNPRIAHEIITATIPYKAKSMLERVEKTNTLIGLMTHHIKFDLNQRLATSEINYLIGVLIQLFHKESHPNLSCSTELANYLRCRSWKLNISGVTVACPLEAFTIQLRDDFMCNHECHNIEAGKIIGKSLLGDQTSVLNNLRVGPSVPYLGKSTKSKIASFFGKSITKLAAPLLKKCASLMMLIGWGVAKESNFSSLLYRLLGAITDLSPSLLELKEAQVSGSVEHRLQDSATKHGCFLPFLYTGSTWLTLNTSTLTKYSKGGANVNLSFQSILIYLESAFTINPWSNVAHCHIACSKCIIPINEEILEIPALNNISIPTFPEDTYFWIPSSSISISQKVHAEMTPVTPYSDLNVLDDTRIKFTDLVVQTYLGIIRSQENEMTSSDTIIHFIDQIPFIWILKMDPVRFISLFSSSLVCFYLYHMLGLCEADRKGINNWDTWKEEVISYIRNLSDKWLTPLTSLFINPLIISTLSRIYHFALPSGCPPSISAKCESLKSCLISAVANMDNLNMPQLYALQKWPEYGWIWRVACQDLISNKISRYHLHTLKSIFPVPILKETGNSVTVNWILSNALNSDKYLDSQYKDYLNNLNKYTPVLCDINPDTLAKLLSEFTDDSGPSLQCYNNNNLTECITNSATSFVIYSSTHNKSQQSIGQVSLSGIEPYKPHLNKYSALTEGISFVSLFKPSLLSTTSIYKAVGLVKSLPLSGCSDVICCGDGGGSFSLSCCLLFPNLIITFNTLLNHSEIGPQGLEGFLPSDFYIFTQFHSRLRGLKTCAYGVSDILDKRWVSQFLHYPSETFIICDAEFSFGSLSKYLKVIDTFVMLIRSIAGKGFMIKIYKDNNRSVGIVIGWLSNIFQNVKLVRSYFSNSLQEEYYLICSNLIKRKTSITNTIMFDETRQSIEYSIHLNPDELEYIHSKMRIHKVPKWEELEKISKQLIPIFSNLGIVKSQTPCLTSLNIPTKGSYPMDTHIWWDHEMDHIERYTWQGYLKLKINHLTKIQVKNFMLRHLILLSILINNSADFKEWLQIIEKGWLIMWMNKRYKWRSAISRKKVYSSCLVKWFKISSHLSRPELKALINEIASIRAFNRLHHIKIDVTLDNPLLPSKFSVKKWFHYSNPSYEFFELPLILSDSKNIFSSFYEMTNRRHRLKMDVDGEYMEVMVEFSPTSKLLSTRKIISRSLETDVMNSNNT